MIPLFQRIIRLFCVVLAFILLFLTLALGVVIYLNNPPGGPLTLSPEDQSMRLEEEGSLLFEVRGGETPRSVGKRLEEGGIIRSRYFFYVLSRLKREHIKTGIYRLELPASQISIHSLLLSGRQLLIRLTIPEGVTLKKTARLFDEAGICGEEEFLAAASGGPLKERYRIPGPTMEGYLYPDTYFFPLAFPPERVVSTMADTFFARLGEFVPEALSLPPEDLFKRITLASIVEREYRVDEEAALMAGVFYNRLSIGMALQSCATVEYVITEIQGRPHPKFLYTRDTEIRNPYNTYLRPGLPPGPISAPGKAAILAAFYPVSSDYLYFRLTDPAAGQHYFSRTLDDHIRAGALYVKGW
jgi:UPF0755 protein